jgi:hypothetical protein
MGIRQQDPLYGDTAQPNYLLDSIVHCLMERQADTDGELTREKERKGDRLQDVQNKGPPVVLPAAAHLLACLAS